MKTLQDEWKEYRDACYPTGIPIEQNIECHQAFFAGALVVLKLAVERAEGMTDEQKYKQIFDLIKEAQQVCQNRVYTMKSRN